MATKTTIDGAIIGIDNGINGGLCAISASTGVVVDYTKMPVAERRGKDEVDTDGLLKWIKRFNPAATFIAIEEPLHFTKTLAAMRSMSVNFGLTIGFLRAHGYSIEPVQVRDWQSAMLGKFPRGKSKEVALKKACQTWPNEHWLAGPRCKTPHDGIVDAALIAAYTRASL